MDSLAEQTASRRLRPQRRLSQQLSGWACRGDPASPHSVIAPGSTRRAVQAFIDFSPDNDPYSEHDFGFFKPQGEFFWKIDAYDPR
jgi:hypothetical protein